MVFAKVYLMFIIELKINLKSKYLNKEKSKFKNRNLHHPEQFLPLVLEEILNQLHSILNLILLQTWVAP
tara:strand:+ start:888 stop:1094 length:207 start_codon:yes stop_codon:yes gene_type:complete